MGTALGIIAAHIIEQREKAIEEAKRSVGVKKLAIPGEQQMNLIMGIGKSLYEKVPETVRGLIPSLAMLVLTLGIGMVIIWYDKRDITFIEMFYFAVITGTTIGYGDYSPSSQVGRAVAIVYLYFAVMTIGGVLSSIAGSIVDAKQKKALEKILMKKITMADFEEFDIDGDGKIEKSEFVMRKLLLMGILNPVDVERCEQEFEIMDADGSGEIDMEDLEIYLKEQEANTAREKAEAEDPNFVKKKKGSRFSMENIL